MFCGTTIYKECGEYFDETSQICMSMAVNPLNSITIGSTIQVAVNKKMFSQGSQMP